MLSGKLKYRVRCSGAAFGIGRSARNGLELDGVGICADHCEIAKLPPGTESEAGVEFGLRVFGDAKVHLNGALVEGGGGKRARARGAALYGLPADSEALAAPLTPLHHGDRLILGPCRFVAVFLAFDPAASSDGALALGGGEEHALAREQRLAGATANWEYSAVVAEMLHTVGRVPRLFGSTDASAEGRLWEELLRGLELANQANEIAAEMLVPVQFCVTMTTTLPPHFDETQMHELPSLGAHVVIHCRTVAANDRDPRRRASASPPSPSASSPVGSPTPRRGLARVQSRDSDVEFYPSDRPLQRLFDVSLDVFEDFLAGLHDVFGATAQLCQALHADSEDEGVLGDSGDEPMSPRSSSAPARGRRPLLSGQASSWRCSAVLREVFAAADADGDGLITCVELHGAMRGALGLDARFAAVQPLFDAFGLATPHRMALAEFVDFLTTHLRAKFGASLAHLVTNAKAFADYLGASHAGRAAGSAQRRALLAQAVAADASTEDGRRVSLAALAAHGGLDAAARSLRLPGLSLPRRAALTGAAAEAAEIDVEARHALAVSLARLLDCAPSAVRLRDDDDDDDDDAKGRAASGRPTVTAAVDGLGNDGVNRAIAALVNGDLRAAADAAAAAHAYDATLAQREARVLELEAMLAKNAGSAAAEAAAARANEEVAVLQSLVDALQSFGRPDGLSPTAEKVWASTAAAALLLDALRTTSDAKPPGKYLPRAADAKLREVVVALAELLAVANARVVRAIDDEARLKEAAKRLEAKVAQVVSKATFAKQEAAPTPPAEHVDCLRQLVDARKQLAAMAKDNSAGRMARATAQELALDDDWKDAALEASELAAQARTAAGAAAPRLAAQLEAASASAARLEAEVAKLAARNAKLADAVEERREVRPPLTTPTPPPPSLNNASLSVHRPSLGPSWTPRSGSRRRRDWRLRARPSRTTAPSKRRQTPTKSAWRPSRSAWRPPRARTKACSKRSARGSGKWCPSTLRARRRRGGPRAPSERRCESPPQDPPTRRPTARRHVSSSWNWLTAPSLVFLRARVGILIVSPFVWRGLLGGLSGGGAAARRP
jgi:hypothetical protein